MQVRSVAKLLPERLSELRFVSNPVLSPDGSLVVSVQTSVASDDEGVPFYKSNLFLYDLAGKTSKQLTRSAFSDTKPQFSPDGSSLAFLSRRSKGEKAQLYKLDLSGGEAECLSAFKSGVSAFCWSPDGSSLAFVSRGDWVADDAPARRIVDLRYKFNGVGFLPDAPNQLYLFDLKKAKTKQLSELSREAFELVFSPDGGAIFFTAQDDAEGAKEWQRGLFSLDLTSLKVKKLLKETSMIINLSLSPDAKTVLFNAPSRWNVFASPSGLYKLKASGGKAELLSGEFEMNPSMGGDSRYGDYPNKACWLNEQTVLVNVNEAGKSALKQFDLKTNTFELVYGELSAISSFDARAGKLVFTAETPHEPVELFVKDAKACRQLTKLNTRFVKKFSLQNASEAITIKTKDKSESLTYWTLSPEHPREDDALVIQVHGGPHTNYGYGFYHEFHMLAAAGYTVVYGNPRGGSSFGDEFATCILGRYGSIDADDVLSIARHAKKNHVDKKAPIHLTGGSYGGFMTNWLVGQTHEFASAVTQRSICNWLSFFGTSDIGSWFTPIEQNGNPWDDTDLLWEQSPLKYVKNVKTPTLVLHAEEDHRCPIGEAEQFYAALKHLGKVDTAFVRIPGENHELSRSGRPDRRIARLEFIIDWFETHP